MAANSKIEWTTHTFNPWRGCAKVSDGCRYCYAERLSKRNQQTLGVWGADGTRVIASPDAWRQPLKWNEAAKAAGERHRVFCASLADWLEDRGDLLLARARLLELICFTPHLDWLLLTKRPEHFRKLMDWAYTAHNASGNQYCAEWLHLWLQDALPSNVWIGVSVEDQAAADKRIPELLQTPARVRFLSCEPLLGKIDLTRISARDGDGPDSRLYWIGEDAAIDWVIVGGESGPRARPMNIDHLISLRDQCLSAGVPVFIKQLGSALAKEFGCRDPKGGDMSEWPAEYRIRQCPEVGPCDGRE
jgi:protein gp37